MRKVIYENPKERYTDKAYQAFRKHMEKLNGEFVEEKGIGIYASRNIWHVKGVTLLYTISLLPGGRRPSTHTQIELIGDKRRLSKIERIVLGEIK